MTPEARAARMAQAADIIRHHAILCAEAVWLPFWWANSPAITGLQLKMLAEISDVYGIEFAQHKAKPIVASLSGGALNFLLSRHPLSLAAKAWILSIPVLGIPLRFGTGPAIMAAYTWLLGRAFVSHYEAGGRYEDFHVSSLRDELTRTTLGLRWAQTAG